MTDLFDWMPEGTTHVDQMCVRTVPCYGLKARFSPFKYVDGVLYTYRTDTDDEYGRWQKAAPLYKNGKTPEVYPLSALHQHDDTALLQQALEALDDCVWWIYALRGTGGIGCLPMQAVKAAAVAGALKERLK